MLLFFFDIHEPDGATLDDAGSELQSLADAKRIALKTATDMLSDKGDRYWVTIQVRQAQKMLLKIHASVSSEEQE